MSFSACWSLAAFARRSSRALAISARAATSSFSVSAWAALAALSSACLSRSRFSRCMASSPRATMRSAVRTRLSSARPSSCLYASSACLYLAMRPRSARSVALELSSPGRWGASAAERAVSRSAAIAAWPPSAARWRSGVPGEKARMIHWARWPACSSRSVTLVLATFWPRSPPPPKMRERKLREPEAGMPCWWSAALRGACAAGAAAAGEAPAWPVGRAGVAGPDGVCARALPTSAPLVTGATSDSSPLETSSENSSRAASRSGSSSLRSSTATARPPAAGA
mmetsp:Transcript_11485/g.44528  ORF Transcript_11485/g.44528 Transcript_11485/m.44528 type:complete len:283 (-) Transcript_11485:25-873(-)